jgi:hypothetical protein
MINVYLMEKSAEWQLSSIYGMVVCQWKVHHQVVGMALFCCQNNKYHCHEANIDPSTLCLGVG